MLHVNTCNIILTLILELESDTDRSSLPESESLVKQERLSAEYQLQRPSSENSFTDHRHSEGKFENLFMAFNGNKFKMA